MARKDSNTGTGKRATMGTSAYGRVDDRSGKEFDKGQLVQRKPNGGMEQATARSRGVTGPDRLGPRFAVGVKMPGPIAPEASLTQQNTRFMKSAVNRSQPNFNLGMMG